MNDNSQSFSVSLDFADNVVAFDSRVMETSVTFGYTFQESGPFEYYFTVRPNMVQGRGILVILERKRNLLRLKGTI